MVASRGARIRRLGEPQSYATILPSPPNSGWRTYRSSASDIRRPLPGARDPARKSRQSGALKPPVYLYQHFPNAKVRSILTDTSHYPAYITSAARTTSRSCSAQHPITPATAAFHTAYIATWQSAFRATTDAPFTLCIANSNAYLGI